MGVALEVPWRLLQPRIDVLVAREQRHVDRLQLLAANQPGAGIARGSDQVEAALVINATISSEVPAVLTLTLQPDFFSNSVTQSKFLSVAPRSI